MEKIDNGYIFKKIDWFTAVFRHTTIKDIFDCLNFDIDIFDEMLSSSYLRSQGMIDSYAFTTNGMSVDLKYSECLTYVSNREEIDSFSVFNTKFEYIRLDLSGTGLDYLRNQGLQVDTVLTCESFWGLLQYDVTRCDFAFDFINCHEDFVQKLGMYLVNLEGFGCGRVRTNGSRTSLCYSVHLGDRRTIYLGKTSGNKLLRIYDKKLQYTDRNTGLLLPNCPSFFVDDIKIDIESWFRIELQTRRKEGSKYLYGCDGDIGNVLICLFDHYLVLDSDGQPLEFMANLYDWTKLTPIIQNANFV